MDTANQINSLKQRDSTIDIIKGFAMIAVVLLHINFAFPKIGILNTNSLFGGLWHVAVFFCGKWMVFERQQTLVI